MNPNLNRRNCDITVNNEPSPPPNIKISNMRPGINSNFGGVSSSIGNAAGIFFNDEPTFLVQPSGANSSGRGKKLKQNSEIPQIMLGRRVGREGSDITSMPRGRLVLGRQISNDSLTLIKKNVVDYLRSRNSSRFEVYNPNNGSFNVSNNNNTNNNNNNTNNPKGRAGMFTIKEDYAGGNKVMVLSTPDKVMNVSNLNSPFEKSYTTSRLNTINDQGPTNLNGGNHYRNQPQSFNYFASSLGANDNNLNLNYSINAENINISIIEIEQSVHNSINEDLNINIDMNEINPDVDPVSGGQPNNTPKTSSIAAKERVGSKLATLSDANSNNNFQSSSHQGNHQSQRENNRISSSNIGQILDLNLQTINLPSLVSPFEEQMLFKYAKYWHYLAIAYQSLSLWNESINCLYAVLPVYKHLKLLNHLLVTFGDILLSKAMLKVAEIYDKKPPDLEDLNFNEKISNMLTFLDDCLRDCASEKNTLWIYYLKLINALVHKDKASTIIYADCILVVKGNLKENLQPEEENFFKGVHDLKQRILNEKNNEGFRSPKWSISTSDGLLRILCGKEVGEAIGERKTSVLFPSTDSEEIKKFLYDTNTRFRCVYIKSKGDQIKLPCKIKNVSHLMIKMGNCLRLWLGLSSHAIFFYDCAYQYDKSNYKALFFLALTLRALGRPTHAIDIYARALKINPYFTDCFFNMGNIYLQDLNNPEEAEKSYCKALFSFEKFLEQGNSPLVSKSRIWNLLAEALKAKGDFFMAVIGYLNGLQIDFGCRENYIDLAEILSYDQSLQIYSVYFAETGKLLGASGEEQEDLRIDELQQLISHVSHEGGNTSTEAILNNYVSTRPEFKHLLFHNVRIQDESQLQEVKETLRAILQTELSYLQSFFHFLIQKLIRITSAYVVDFLQTENIVMDDQPSENLSRNKSLKDLYVKIVSPLTSV
eukprot:TRINITY_DN6371_c0_g1_i2.p1 TRINITY_DN6371_c0_g1~~TRINITY_DN6371_c0_g1_i2.p1  ORF type:complete len:934 (+),score=180.19 TRINITY_DN6371_c0_g1_i2:3-2804(+)